MSIVWDFDPVFISIGSFEIRYYGVMWALAILIAAWFFDNFCKREGLPQKVSGSAFVYGTIATILGARLGHCLFYDPVGYLSEPWTIITGEATTLPWGFEFVRSHKWLAEYAPAAVHPTQIYEALCYLLTFGILCWLYYGKDLARRRPGILFGVGLIGIFLTRFIIEFIKTEQEAFEVGWTLDMGQWLSIPFIVLGIFMIWWGASRPAVDPAPMTKGPAAKRSAPASGSSSGNRKNKKKIK